MFAKYLILLCVVEFCKSSDTDLNDQNRDSTTTFFINSGCDSKTTLDQLAAAEKCYEAASTETHYYENVMKTVEKGGDCEKFIKMESKIDDSDIANFCQNIISVQDENTQMLVECIGESQGKYPDPKIIANTPECKAFVKSK